MKNCIACAHFEFDFGWSGTEITPGSSPEVDCKKGHWKRIGRMSMYDNQNILLEKTSLAEICQDYELSDLAKSKGWTP